MAGISERRRHRLRAGEKSHVREGRVAPCMKKKQKASPPRKPAGKKAKSRKKSESRIPDRQAPSPKAAKRRRVVAGLIEGKSQRKAAIDAGFSPSMADNFKQKILPGVQTEFQQELEQKVPRAVLIRRLAEGLNAKETRLTQFEGEFTDQRHLVAWSERRHYAELVAKLLGLLVQRVELTGDKGGPVEIADVSSARDKLFAKLGRGEVSRAAASPAPGADKETK